MIRQSHWHSWHKHWTHPAMQDWLRSGAIPDLGADGELCPNSKGHRREEAELNFRRGKAATNDDVLFNYVMSQNVAPFADIISEFTRSMYGRARTVGLFKVLCKASDSFINGAQDFGTRGWMRRVCQEALG